MACPEPPRYAVGRTVGLVDVDRIEEHFAKLFG